MKKLRITPLNIVAALALAFFIISFFQTDKNRGHVDFSVFYKVIFGGMVLVAFITDMIFRFIFKDLKRIWFVELFFIALTVTLFLIIQKYYF
jgi:hypothetical protein